MFLAQQVKVAIWCNYNFIFLNGYDFTFFIANEKEYKKIFVLYFYIILEHIQEYKKIKERKSRSILLEILIINNCYLVNLMYNKLKFNHGHWIYQLEVRFLISARENNFILYVDSTWKNSLIFSLDSYYRFFRSNKETKGNSNMIPLSPIP